MSETMNLSSQEHGQTPATDASVNNPNQSDFEALEGLKGAALFVRAVALFPGRVRDALMDLFALFVGDAGVDASGDTLADRIAAEPPAKRVQELVEFLHENPDAAAAVASLLGDAFKVVQLLAPMVSEEDPNPRVSEGEARRRINIAIRATPLVEDGNRGDSRFQRPYSVLVRPQDLGKFAPGIEVPFAVEVREDELVEFEERCRKAALTRSCG